MGDGRVSDDRRCHNCAFWRCYDRRPHCGECIRFELPAAKPSLYLKLFLNRERDDNEGVLVETDGGFSCAAHQFPAEHDCAFFYSKPDDACFVCKYATGKRGKSRDAAL